LPSRNISRLRYMAFLLGNLMPNLSKPGLNRDPEHLHG
jgi:hypothetical protein